MADKSKLTQLLPPPPATGTSRWKTQWNAEQFPNDPEVKPALLPSMTVPDQSLSVKEIMTRFAQGMPLDLMRDGRYSSVEELEEDLIPGLEKMDLAGRMAAISEIQAEIQELNAKYRDQVKELRKRPRNRSEDIDHEDIPNNNPKKTPPEANEKERAQRAKNPRSGADGKNSQGAAATD